MKTWLFCGIWIVLLVTYVGKSQGDRITFEVANGAKACFYYDGIIDQKMKLEGAVLRGGAMDIGLIIRSGHGSLVYSSTVYERLEQQFIAASNGSYEICWDNGMSRGGDKIVQFELLVDAQIDGHEFVTTKNLDPVTRSIMEIETSLHEIQEDQQYLKLREQRHRDTADSLYERVVWWSLVESVVLIVLTVVQVYTLRNFFDIKRKN